MAQMVKCLSTVQETWIQSLGQKDLLEKEMATHSSILAWKIPWTEEPGRLQSTGSQRVRWLSNFTFTCNSITNFPIWHPCVNPSDRGPEIAIFFFWMTSKDISSNKNNYCIVVIFFCRWEMFSRSKELFYVVSLLPDSKAL